MMRLDKYLSERLGIPRGESRKLAAKGRVTVNGVLTKKADTQLEEATAEVAVDGRLLAGAYQKYVYLMLNKPEGVVSAAQDKRDTTVVDLVKDAFPRRQLFPAGRLDKTSTGFVLFWRTIYNPFIFSPCSAACQTPHNVSPRFVCPILS